jgi:pimeloyl-ACP methyl ester carboxylesterase
MSTGLKMLEASPKMADITGVKEIGKSLSELDEQRILYLYGLKDEFITDDDLNEYREALPANITLQSFDGCGHNELFEHDENGYLDLILGFMNNFDQIKRK